MKAPVLLSLYSGAGGLDYGFEAAGFRTGVAVEMDHDCCETLRRNRSWSVVERSIFEVSTSEMLRLAGTRTGDVDLVIGGPPCQPFSKAGFWARGEARRLSDPRASTLGAYFRVVDEALPRAFVLENVEGIGYAGKDEGLQLISEEIGRINKLRGTHYEPRVMVVNAADYGVPQLRTRVLVIASRDGTPFQLPNATHGITPASPHLTAWDAIGNLATPSDEDLALRGKWADLLPSIPEGRNYLWHTDRGGGQPLFGWRRRYWTFLLKLAKAKPSWTIQAQPGPAVGPFHWDNRRLSHRELCRLQTFPDDVNIFGNRISVQRQVGNAVPSLLGEVLGRAIRTQLLDRSALRKPLALLPSRLPEPPPAPEPAAVPSRFMSLAGAHSAHPGTGQGHRARARALQGVLVH